MKINTKLILYCLRLIYNKYLLFQMKNVYLKGEMIVIGVFIKFNNIIINHNKMEENFIIKFIHNC